MFNPDTTHIFLPCWREGRLLFFTDIKEGYSNRLEYRVAAATAKGHLKVERTFKAQISPEQLALCQETAYNAQNLQQFFQVLGSGNLGHLVDETLLTLPPCAGKSIQLIYVCSYLSLLRKYAVDQQIVKNYEAQTREQRFSPDSALAIYKILAAHLQPERASTLIDVDIPDDRTIRGNKNIVANLLREAAIAKFDAKAFSRAEALMLRAVKLQESEDKWRRLADFSLGMDAPEQAINYFLNAEKLKPLAAPPAFRLAKLLIDAARADEAKAFLDRAETAFPKPVETLRQKMAS